MKKILNRIETLRCILKAPSLEYSEILQQTIEASIQNLRVWLNWAQYIPSVESCTNFINNSITAFDEEKEMQFYIFTREDNSFIGCAGFQGIDWSVPKVELGYWIGTSYQGQGYATEVSQLLTEYAFNNLEVNRVEIRCDDNNVRSKSVARKVGFQLEGILRNDTLTPVGQLRDTAVFSRIKCD